MQRAYALLLTPLTLLALACPPNPANAQAQADEPEPIVKDYEDPLAQLPRTQVLELLNDPSYQVREQAVTHLLADNTLGREAITRLIDQATSDEQRFRLIRLAEHHVLREIRETEFANPESDKAAVGFSYLKTYLRDSPVGPIQGVSVSNTMPGFPGHAHLRPGDIIIGIDEVNPINPGFFNRDLSQTISSSIEARKPGEQIRFVVIRDDQALRITITCAQADALRDMYSTNNIAISARNAKYEKAWQQAREQLLARLPKPQALTPDN